MFGDGPRKPLSGDKRRAWLARAHAERRAGRLTTLHVEVARTLMQYLGEDGRCDPSHATLARDVNCDPSTILRALKALRKVDMLVWEKRLVRRPWPAGILSSIRAEQTSNAYELLLPARPIAPSLKRPQGTRQHQPDCDRQVAGESPTQLIQRMFPGMTEAEIVALQATTKTRRERLDAELRANWTERCLKRGQPSSQVQSNSPMTRKGDG